MFQILSFCWHCDKLQIVDACSVIFSLQYNVRCVTPTLMLIAADTSLRFHNYSSKNFATLQTTVLTWLNFLLQLVPREVDEIKVFACSAFQKTLS